MSFLKHFSILPVLVFVAAIAFGLRFSELAADFSLGNKASAQQEENTPADMAAILAQTEPAAASSEEAQEQVMEEGGEGAEMAEEADNLPPPPRVDAQNMDGERVEWRDSLDTDFEYSNVQMELFEDLSRRREALEKRERELAMREALLKAAEKEMDQKYKELLSIRNEIQELMQEQSEDEQERIASLVKIYEGMKAKDAARIFNTLEMDVLIEVMARMSERKSAPIIAAMNPERARSVTILLAQRESLPDFDDGDL